MPISETIQYIIIFALAVVFTSFALAMEKHRITLKVIAGICWFILALAQFILDVAGTFSMPFATLFMAIGLILFLSTILDWTGEKKTRFFRSLDE